MVGSIDLVKTIEKLKSALEIRKIIKHIRVVLMKVIMPMILFLQDIFIY